MSFSKRISPYVTQFISSDQLLTLRRNLQEINRKRRGAPHQLTVFHKVDDPYSYLLLQMLQRLMGDFDIKVKPLIISELDATALPEPELLKNWALKDAQLLAKAFKLEFPTAEQLPSAELCKRAEKILLSNEQSDSFLKFAIDVNKALWSEGEQAIQALEQEVGRVSDEQRQHLLEKSRKKLKSLGHYLAGTIFYNGEWYWGVDRIYHLVERLLTLDIAKTDVTLSDYDYPKTELTSAQKTKATHPLDFYFSFRSPYSYLAAQRLSALQKNIDIEIHIKPVLPMVMRGLPVPSAKRFYIYLDTKRECNRYCIPFGKSVDPLGTGVENCMALFTYAEQQNKGMDFICTVSRGIWAEGKDVSRLNELQALTERAGLDWQAAKLFLSNTSWHGNTEQNRKDMFSLGFWGVPSFQYADFSFWGQDRLWALEQQLLIQS